MRLEVLVLEDVDGGVADVAAFLVLDIDGVDGVDHGAAEAVLLERGHALDGGAARRAHGVLHRAGMRAGFQMKLGGAHHHLRREAVGGGARQAVLHAGVAERFQEHRGERGAAAGDGAGRGKQLAVDPLDERDPAEQVLERLQLLVGERVALLAGDHARAHGDGRVGDGAEVAAVRGEDALVEREVAPGGY